MFICPMHPEIHQETPGDCSICKMALEPVIPQDTSEYSTYFNRLISGTLLFILLLLSPTLFLSYSPWMQLLVTTILIGTSGWIFFRKGWCLSKPRTLNMFSLISLGVFSSYLYSTSAVFFPEYFSKALHTSGRPDLYFETVAAIILLVLLGQVLEKKAKRRTQSSISLLLARAPSSAHRLENEKETEISVSQIQVEDILLVKPGDKIPTDGVLIQGESFVDESMFTGEPFPVKKKPASQLIGGTINQSGAFTMKAEKIGSDTALMRMITLVTEAQKTKAPIQKLADTVASYFTPIVLLIAVATFFYWLFISSSHNFQFALLNSVSVLIIACPCALGLATPLSLMVGIGKGAESGIFFKNGEAVENLAQVNAIVLDKTGTLTEGHPRVTSIHTESQYQEDELLQNAASLEMMSSHPIAQAILHEAKKKQIVVPAPEHFLSFSGLGVQGNVQGKTIIVGNEPFMKQKGISVPEHSQIYQGTIIHIAIDNKFAGCICITDPINPTANQAIQQLKELKLTVSMVTGDASSTAQSVAQKLNIDTFASSISPEGKCTFIKNIQSQQKIVAMVGDGVNDAPALATANVGIAIGRGTDVAIESGSIVLTRSDPKDIVESVALSRKIMKNIRQNLFFAFFYNVLSIPIAAGLLYPHFHLLFRPEFASIAMALSSLCVIGNALRIKY